MRNLGRFALTISAAASFAGCGGSQPPIGAPGSTPQSRATVRHAERGGSWMLPEAKSEDLLYAADGSNNVVVLSFPHGAKVGRIASVRTPRGLCADSKGDVFVTNHRPDQVLEFAHGSANPFNTLVLTRFPTTCSWDPTTGNLAVLLGNNQIAVFPNSQGTPTTYTDYQFNQFWACTYDNHGDLFIDGNVNGFRTLTELAPGSSSFTNISLSEGIPYLYGLQWDGKYLALDNFGGGSDQASEIYQVSVSGSTGTIVGTTDLSGTLTATYSWIQGGTLIAPTLSQGTENDVAFWAYPSGGSPRKILPRRDFRRDANVTSVTVSVSQ